MEVTPVSSLDDASELATALKSQYETARDACLEVADWSFASKQVQLPQLDTNALPGFTPDDDLPYSFGLPSDCLRIQNVYGGVRWRIDAECLRANAPAPLRLRYTAKVFNETRMPPEFRIAVAYRLAATLAYRWTNTQGKVAALMDMANSSLKRAMRNQSRDASSERYDGGSDTGDWAKVARQ